MDSYSSQKLIHNHTGGIQDEWYIKQRSKSRGKGRYCKKDACAVPEGGEVRPKKTKARLKVVGVPMSDEEIERRKQELLSGLTSKTWRDLEMRGKFKKDEKLSFVDDDTLIIGCDVGCYPSP